jgi:putative DNA methylase
VEPGSKGKPGVAPTGEKIEQVFDNQALNPQFNYGCRSAYELLNYLDRYEGNRFDVSPRTSVFVEAAKYAVHNSDLVVSDPPYADAIVYEELTEFFIAWLRKNPPPPFDQWSWDSHRDLAIKGKDEKFRRDMVAAYGSMTRHMPDNGLQLVMFTHQDAGVWADLGSILWAAGLRVTAAWNVVTETEPPADGVEAIPTGRAGGHRPKDAQSLPCRPRPFRGVGRAVQQLTRSSPPIPPNMPGS